VVDTIYCVHCGAVAKHPVTKTIAGQVLSFCCGGCLQVYEMMHEEGLLADPEGSQPHSSFEGPQASVSGPFQSITLPVVGMSCANCVASVERNLRRVAGVRNVSVNLASGEATVEIGSNQVRMDSLKQAVKEAGYKVP
jgi:copper chaperone CopZ